MIGDAAPHPPNSEASRGYDWRMEVGQLNREMGVSVYGVQCLKEDKATPFWAELAERTAGRHLQLDQVGSVVDMIMAIVYREHGAGFFDAYEQEVRAREGNGMRHELEDMFHRLRDEDRPAKRPAQGDASPAKRACKAAKAEPKPKRAKPKAKRAEPKAKRTEAKAKRTEPKAKRTEPKPKVLKNKKPTRESVQQSHFVLNTLRWSPWRKAMSLVAPDDGAQWMPRRGAEPGFRNASLFTDSKRSKPAVYEFAVQTGAHRKLHVVFFRCSRAIPTGCRWDRHLLRGAGIQAMISKVLKQRAAGNHVILMARRAFLPESGVEVAGKQHMGSRGVAALLKTRYDYAWRPCSDRRQEITRPVQRNQCFISQ
ncbi:hypothetical protein CAPTEDRAFT_193317 [Capitella teleta]|uniref:Uncharacterized protein n=1 Tax=Capitella teleta TaxID=283909 RepID=R7UU37_CAPTE|nr:hypothetical protein CAPTEDRAFT_193317 [Capitella teleta]|eukprot:ELU10024.1 hypothetical protein CAPTEDRAFT_193317 [Capitella teleta]